MISKEGFKQLYSVAKTQKKPKMIFEMGEWEFQILAPPPRGHLGCYATLNSNPALKEGDTIGFSKYGQLSVLAVIVFIEPPTQCCRPDMEEFVNWYKIHWVPSAHIRNFHRKRSIRMCPKCHKSGAKVYDSRPTDGKIIRLRRCLKCGTRWSTIETFIGVLNAKDSVIS